MRIAPLSFGFKNTIQKLHTNNSQLSFKNLQYDVFDKKKNPPLVEELLVAADKQKITGNDKEKVIALLKYALVGKKIGKGSEGKAYLIPDTDLVIKIFKKNQDNEIIMPKCDLTATEQSRDILALGSNYEITRFNKGIIQKRDFDKKQKKAYDFLIFNLEQSAYDDYLKTIGDKHSRGIFFDTLGYNVVVNVDDKKFNPIDLSDEPYCTSYYYETDGMTGCKINPADCFAKSLGIDVNNPDGNKFVAKVFKAIAKDCKYFPYFTYCTRPLEGFDNINNYKVYRSLYNMLISLHQQKIKLYNEGLSEEKIQKTLKKNIDGFINLIDNRIFQTQDLSKKYLKHLENIITQKS